MKRTEPRALTAAMVSAPKLNYQRTKRAEIMRMQFHARRVWNRLNRKFRR